ncbi:Ig domain-containing protein [Candidatus Saccharibacteria bacterium]|nr:Ig domain-containing protein [Candidatus Saccharibacteria bacterium]
MKKILSAIVIIFSIICFTSVPAFANDACTIAGVDDPLICGTPDSDEETALIQRTRGILSTVYLWIGIITVIVIVIGGIQYMTSTGESEKTKRAKSTIIYAIVGLVVVLGSFAITNFIIDGLEGNEPGVAKSDAEDDSKDGPKRDEVKSIVLASKIMMIVGQKITLSPKIIPDYASNKTLSYRIDNKTVATVSNTGTVKAVKAGSTKIIVEAVNKVSKEVELEVKDPVAAEKINVSPQNLTLMVGRTKQIKYSITPTNAVDKTLTWTSSNKKVATVSQYGLISGIKEGEATITVTARNKDIGKSEKVTAQIKVKVVTKTQTKDDDNDGNDGNDSGSTPGNGERKTSGDTKNQKYSGWLDFREETRQIVKKHMKDFNWKNFDSYMASHGGYPGYVKSLGGVFAKFGGDDKKIPIKTAADIQESAEYFYGIFSILGPDYSAGGRWPVWGQDKNNHGVSKKGTSDGFYYGYGDRPYKSSKSSHCGRHVQMSIDYELTKGYKGKSCIKKRIRNNCNYSQDSWVRQTNLKLPSSSKKWTSSSSYHHGKTIRHTKDLQVGDWVNFWNSGGSWIHIALVGEVYSDKVVLYDGGGRFNRDRHYKKIMYRNTDSLKNTTYSKYKKWKAVRLWDIDQSVTLDGINDKPKNWIW